jgi:hypothetical protein
VMLFMQAHHSAVSKHGAVVCARVRELCVCAACVGVEEVGGAFVKILSTL